MLESVPWQRLLLELHPCSSPPHIPGAVFWLPSRLFPAAATGLSTWYALTLLPLAVCPGDDWTDAHPPA
ncbi:hypothetical protein, partial [Salmonella enterica]|uniref:hypothetical protein n=1 Tax=Salmonella enterica TaxID=28901 RepID=UPI00398C823D